MKVFFIMSLLIIVSFFSCNRTESSKKITVVQDTIKIGKIKANYTAIELNNKARKAVENWIEYQKIDEFIHQFGDISRTDAMFNANELSELAQQLKDSIRIEDFQIPSVKIRLNVLHNEALRLADMATIPKISENEIRKENENILNAFSALNLKINNIINLEYLNEELTGFIDELVVEPNMSQTAELTEEDKVSKDSLLNKLRNQAEIDSVVNHRKALPK